MARTAPFGGSDTHGRAIALLFIEWVGYGSPAVPRSRIVTQLRRPGNERGPDVTAGEPPSFRPTVLRARDVATTAAHRVSPAASRPSDRQPSGLQRAVGSAVLDAAAPHLSLDQPPRRRQGRVTAPSDLPSRTAPLYRQVARRFPRTAQPVLDVAAGEYTDSVAYADAMCDAGPLTACRRMSPGAPATPSGCDAPPSRPAAGCRSPVTARRRCRRCRRAEPAPCRMVRRPRPARAAAVRRRA